MNLVLTDNFNHYMKQIEQIPLLSSEEEFAYACDYYENKTITSAQILIQSNLRYVVKLVYDYQRYELPRMDLIQEGNIGMMMALKKYNPYKRVSFRYYASFWIKAYIQKYIINNWSLLKIGSSAKAIKHFYNTDKKLELLDQDDSFIYEMKARMQGELSLNTLDEFGNEIIDHLQSDLNQEQLLIEYQEENRIKDTVQNVINKLNDRDKYVLEHRILNDEKKTFKEIGQELNISSERVRQLEEKIIKNLKNELGELEWK